MRRKCSGIKIMNRINRIILVVLSLFIFSSCKEKVEQASFGLLPSDEEVSWQKLEYLMCIEPDYSHYEAIKPSVLGQWVKIAKSAGMRGILMNIDGSMAEGKTIRRMDKICAKSGLRLFTYPLEDSVFNNGKDLLDKSDSWSVVSGNGEESWQPKNILIDLDSSLYDGIGVEDMFDIYLKSVGNNGTLIVNVSLSENGMIESADSALLAGFRNRLNEAFHVDYAKMSRCLSEDVRKMKPRYAASNIVDGRYDTYWTTDDSLHTASFTVYFMRNRVIGGIMIQEYIPMGQRVKSFNVEFRESENAEWKEICSGTTIGYKKLLLFNPVEAAQVRFNILDSYASPQINNVAIFAPSK